MTNNAAYAGFVVLASCLEAANLLKILAHLKPWLFGTAYFFILSYLLVKNQEDIDSNIFDKKHVEKSMLPRNLRRFNTFWVCLLFLAVVLFFNLKPIVVYLLKLLRNALIYAAAFFAWLAGHLFGSTGGTQQGSPSGGFAFFGEEAEMINPLKNLISNMLRNAVLLYIGYRLLLAFIKWAPVLASGLAALFRKLFSAPKSGSEFESSDYSDEIETVRPVREHDRRKQLRKKMKISFRALKGISDPVERVRYMYAALLTLLPSIGIKTEQSDTTSEILKKAAVSPVISGELSPFTQVYNQVRYGEVIPDGSMLASAEEHFNKAVEGFGQK